MKVLPAIFSYEDMKRRFAQDNPDDPYTRRADLESGIYELDSWLIRVDDNDKAISTVGFKEHPSHTVVGGMYATEYGESIGGNSKALQDAREPQLNPSKPLVASFKHRRGDNARWIANAKKNGWSFPDSENWEQMSSLLPKDVLNAWLSKYPETMAIRPIRDEGQMAKCVYLDDPTPQWFSLMKSNYKRQLGSSGFNVIRTSDGKRMNSKGLSRSQAKSMIDDLNSGKDVSRYQKKKKSITGGWKGQLRKFYPNHLYGQDPRPKDKASEGYAETKQFDKTGIIFMPHFMHSKKTRYRNLRHRPIDSAIEQTLLNLSEGKYWCYINDSPSDKSYLILEVLGASKKLPRTKVTVSSLLDDKGNNYTKAIAITHINDGHPYPPYERLDILYNGLKRNHREKGSRRRPDEPTNPFNMGGRR